MSNSQSTPSGSRKARQVPPQSYRLSYAGVCLFKKKGGKSGAGPGLHTFPCPGGEHAGCVSSLNRKTIGAVSDFFPSEPLRPTTSIIIMVTDAVGHVNHK